MLALRGYLTDDERVVCNELHRANPLLFDFALKRSVCVRESGREHRFPARVFETSWLFGA